MKKFIYSSAQIVFAILITSALFTSCTIERDPAITSLKVCDTGAKCDNHLSTIAKSASFITANITADNLEESNSFEFTIYVNDGGTWKELANSGQQVIEGVLNGTSISDEGQILAYSWISQVGEDWTPGSYRMEARIDTDPVLIETIEYIVVE